MGHRVVRHRYASSLEHLAEDHTQWTCPRPLLQIVDRFVSQEQGIEVVHDDPFGVALLDALHEAFERVVFLEFSATARATSGPSLSPSSTAPPPTYQTSCPPWAAALANRVVVYSSISVATSLTKKESLMPTHLLRTGPTPMRPRAACLSAPERRARPASAGGPKVLGAPRGRAGP